MKKFIVGFGVFWLLTGTVTISAQEKFVQGEIEINGEIYNIRFSDMFPSIHVRNITKNINPTPPPKKRDYIPLDIREGDMTVDTARERSIVYEVLASKMEQLEENNDQLSISYVFYQHGKVMNISYSLPDTTLITPKELAEIDKRLRDEMRAQFKRLEYLEFSTIDYSSRRPIKF